MVFPQTNTIAIQNYQKLIIVLTFLGFFKLLKKSPSSTSNGEITDVDDGYGKYDVCKHTDGSTEIWLGGGGGGG